MDKLTSNLGIKFLIILAAFLLWLYVSAGEARIGVFPSAIPVEVKNKPANLEPVLSQNKVNLKIAADGSVWKKLTVSSFKAFVDLEGLEAGTSEVEVQGSSNQSGVKIMEIKPAKVLVSLEEVIKKTVKVSVRIEGEAAPDKVADIPIPEKETVEIAGPKSLVEKITEAQAMVTLKGEAEDFEREITLQVLDEENQPLENITITPSSIKIKVPIVQSGQVKTVGLKPQITERPKTGFWVSSVVVEPATITLSGASERLRQIQFIETDPISVKDLDKEQTVSVSVKIPSGTKVVGSVPEVKVTIGISQVESLKEIPVAFQVNNLASDLKVSESLPTVTTLLTGPIGALGGASGKSVAINLNLDGKTEGKHSFEIKKEDFVLPSEVRVSSYLPSSISLTLAKK